MADDRVLREWVKEHKVVWELAPWRELVDHHLTAVGFELDLFARHVPQTDRAPGCPGCVQLYEGLKEIALRALPKDARACRCEIEPFDSALRFRPESDRVPEVQLTIRIVHGEGYLRPVDECERRCAQETERSLGRLGVQPKAWTEHGAA